MRWELAACRVDSPVVQHVTARLSDRLGWDVDVYDMFFPPATDHPDEPFLAGAAVALCNTCPLIVECGEYAASNGQFDGIHGGLRKPAKKALAKKLGVPRHGTITGYTADRCRCQDCRDVKTAYDRRTRPRKRAA